MDWEIRMNSKSIETEGLKRKFEHGRNISGF